MSALTVEHLTVRYRSGRHSLTALDDVSLEVPDGAVVGLVGESGSGKSTLARALVGLAPLTSGRIVLGNTEIVRPRNARRRGLGRQIQLVLQDPYTSLDPRMTIGASIAEGLRSDRSIPDRARELGRLLELVGLDPDLRDSLPRELSGGQRQRVALVRALAAKPTMLIADEITSALDASVQGSILNLVNEIHSSLQLTMLFISHNLAAVRYVSDIIAVMYLGQIVELAAADDVLNRPQHPYTQALLAAIPQLGSAFTSGPSNLAGREPPDPHHPPPGCRFHTRCPVGPLVNPERDICQQADPATTALSRTNRAACHFVPAAAPAPTLDSPAP